MTGGRARPIELELKFRVADIATAEGYLLADTIGPFLSGTAARAVEFEDRYVDTADGAVSRAGFAVRIRQGGRGTIVSIKALAASEGPGGSLRREEIEGPADATTAPLEWPESDARTLLREMAGNALLVEIVTIRQVRRKRLISDGDTRVELSLDEVDVMSGARVVAHFVELEAELVKGPEERLASLADVFGADPMMTATSESKFEAALATLAPSAGAPPDAARNRDAVLEISDPRSIVAAEPGPDAGPQPERETKPGTTPKPKAKPRTETGPPIGAVDPAPEEPPRDDVEAARAEPDTRLIVDKTPGVTGNDDVAEAGRKVMRFHLARMIAREPGVRSGRDIVDVHAMRVATRRQRAAWRVFGSAYRPGRTKRYRNGLREVAARLGAVRDLDVLLEGVDRYRADLPIPEQRALEPLLAKWRAERDEARVLLMRELDSARYLRWLDDYRNFVQTEGAAVLPVAPTQPHRIRDTSATRIWAAYEQVRGYESVLRGADVVTLHDLRIAGKWLRYTLEFVREVLGDESALLLARVTALQDHLGLLNDADVCAARARAFLLEHAGELSDLESPAIGRYLVSREREVTRLQRSVGPAWRGVAGIDFRRALGQVVAGL